MNIYRYHSNSEQLTGHEDRVYLVPELAYNYARKQGTRAPEVEPTIMRNPLFALEYADEVIGDRWLEAEPVIMKDSDVWDEYITHFQISG